MRTYILYHANCWDGFCGAWIARNALPVDTVFIPVQYGQDLPVMEEGSRLYILDFSYSRSMMRHLLSRMHKVTVLDHHKTAEKELWQLTNEFIQRPDLIANLPGSELPEICFDMEKSGGRLTWEYFHPQDVAPWLVDYTEDRDLWLWKLNWSREINAFIRSWPLDFAKWDEFNLVPVGCPRWDTWIDAGSAIIRREQQIIDDHLRHAREIEMDGHKILAVNATVLFSDIAAELAKDRPFGACYFDRADGKRQWSLRSRNGGIDVAELAQAHGGGGHKQAAGFEEIIT